MRSTAIILAAALVCSASAPSLAAPATTKEVSAQRRSRITVTPRATPGPYAQRECEAWLQPENRPSGPVITPQMRCWWR